MKKIKAYIKSHRLSEVTLALHKVENLTGMSVTEVKGFGRECVSDDHQHHNDDPGDFLMISKIEIFCTDAMVDSLINTIEKAAHTGLCGDGKIYVLNVEQAIRISTGERGEIAV
ncbi:MAG TPA: P-II family nitrogen regulator [candidate division Zixibacteria bacterium]|nr:P-II family nitrogen regulator [candidate division Zixibacteria bacterium]